MGYQNQATYGSHEGRKLGPLEADLGGLRKMGTVVPSTIATHFVNG